MWAAREKVHKALVKIALFDPRGRRARPRKIGVRKLLGQRGPDDLRAVRMRPAGLSHHVAVAGLVLSVFRPRTSNKRTIGAYPSVASGGVCVVQSWRDRRLRERAAFRSLDPTFFSQVPDMKFQMLGRTA
jgi:hypothetical protein